VLTLSRIFDVSLASLFESPLAMDPCVICEARMPNVRQSFAAQNQETEDAANDSSNHDSGWPWQAGSG
jgi:hypothetical protein